MFFDNPCEHNGYLITGHAFELAPGRWESRLLVERSGFLPEAMGVVPLCLGPRPAEQQALLAGRHMVDGAGFCLRTATGPA